MVDDLRDLHCLIVDDGPAFLRLFEGMLKNLGIAKVTTARNGSEAIYAIATTPRAVDITLSDLRMVAGNGLQLLQSIRTGQVKNARPDACFVMVSGVVDPEPIKTAAMLDVHGYLAKPLSQERLRSAIIKARNKHFRTDLARYAQVVVPASTL